MKRELKIGWIFGIVSIMTGCASVNDNPYHKIWHDLAYATQDSNTLFVDDGYGIPIAGNTGQTKFNALVTQPLIDNGAYALERDPFRSYVTPFTGRSVGQTSINNRLFSSH